ncbi:uncharacterized protein LOC117104801 [Anneissia japonica]|uniref:uncharacterized protein LOC117104801 n=1 Tax=Anneissia japonica TaxID=1529436 RepID=UPI0014254E94|nr:uncharacterized protein LOC117104801 [Anneissia japonica]
MAATRSRRNHSETPEVLATRYCLEGRDPDGFEIKNFNLKGRGVVARRNYLHGEFLMQYHGLLLSADEGSALEDQASSGYRYFFSFQKKELCMDATEEPVSGPILGRLVNHGEKREINAKVKVLVISGKPALCLFSLRNIAEGEEILYDYGVKDLPWKKNKTTNKSHTNMDLAEGEKLAANRNTSVKEDKDSDENHFDQILLSDEMADTNMETAGGEKSSTNNVTGSQTTLAIEVQDTLYVDVQEVDHKMDGEQSYVPEPDSNFHDESEFDKTLASPDKLTGPIIPVTVSMEKNSNKAWALKTLEELSTGDPKHLAFTKEVTAGPSSPVNTDGEAKEPCMENNVLSSGDDDDDDDASYVLSSGCSDCSDIIPWIPMSKKSKPDNKSLESTVTAGQQTTSEMEVEAEEPCSDTNGISEDNQNQGQMLNNDRLEESAPKNNKRKYRKPNRTCPFCDKSYAKLSRHIASQHSQLDAVKRALILPKKDRLAIFQSFKKEGILKTNRSQAKLLNPSYQRERSASSGSLVMCSICSGFYSKCYIKRHTNICQSASEACCSSVPVPVSLMSCANTYGGDFFNEVLSKFRQDDIGGVCTTDPILIHIGQRLWYKIKTKQDKKMEVRRSVMTDMRRLACLYLEMLKHEETLGQIPSKEGNVADMFKRKNFNHLEAAIDTYTRNNTSDIQTVKAGLKSGLYYLLKSTSKILKAIYLVEEKDELSDDVDKFISLLELNHNFVFGDATYSINQQRQIRLRRPEALPLEDDVKNLRNYTLKKMNEITSDELTFRDIHTFKELRDLVVCRLTLFNARRGGEPSRLLIREWKDAESGIWLNQAQLKTLDPLDKALADRYKITYQSGKGNKHIVPVLFPNDTIEAVKKISSKEARSVIPGIENNLFLFPSTNGSQNHVSGWHAVSSVCDKVKLMNKSTITATKNRHRVSTMCAMMDIPEADRQFIYKHLGHSEETNRNVYQTPLALKEITVVARRLEEIDEGSFYMEVEITETPCNLIITTNCSCPSVINPCHDKYTVGLSTVL